MQNLTLLSTWLTLLIVKELKNRKLLLVRFVYNFGGMVLLHIIKMTKNKSAIAIEGHTNGTLSFQECRLSVGDTQR